MNQELSSFAAHLREMISSEGQALRVPNQKNGDSWNASLRNFESLVLELFALQFKHNSAYRKICEARKLTPDVVEHWTQIPAVPTAAFKELELTSLAPEERMTVFYSSGTTEQKPSRHFHNAETLAVYDASLWKWFQVHFCDQGELVFLTPDANATPHSSLVHMFETVRLKFGLAKSAFTGNISADGSWALDFGETIQKLKRACDSGSPLSLLGTAFSFVHLLDYLTENHLQFQLPQGSRVMETGGYKNRSRTIPKAKLHALITRRLGISRENVICEYGMSELSSQAYDGVRPSSGAAMFNVPSPPDCGERSDESLLLRPGRAHSGSNAFHFPPWARVQIISPETGREVAEGETGLIRVFDLANVFSVAAIQTEDLGICRGNGFELIGRAQSSEPRGCSLMAS